MKLIKLVVFTMVIVLACSLAASAGDKMATLKKIEGKWVIKNKSMSGGIATRYIKFTIDGDTLKVSDWRKGLPPSETSYAVKDVTEKGDGNLELIHHFQKTTSPITIIIDSSGAVKGEGTIGRRSPTFTVFNFSRK